MVKRSPEREEFLSDVLITAIEHMGYGFPGIVEYKYDEANPGQSYAVIYDRYDEDPPFDDSAWKPKQSWRVDIDTIAKGFGIVKRDHTPIGNYADWVKDLVTADRTNGEDGDIDVVGALAVLESAIFGEVTYN